LAALGIGLLGAVGGMGLLSRGADDAPGVLPGNAVAAKTTLPKAAALIATAATADAATPARAIRYGRDIRPLLSDRCLTCHGPDAGKRAAEFRLDQPESAMAVRKSGKRPIAPGNLAESEVWQRIISTDHDEVMPPTTSNKRPLALEEKELIRRWIEAGAIYEPHWAFVPPTTPNLPALRSPASEKWCKNDIDRFIMSRLEVEGDLGIAPAPEAEKATLLRRVFFDLTGLPPTPEEIESFEKDSDKLAYEKWVDRLMSEEPYRTRTAERLATPWLDASRYADTCGIHMDAGRQMWLWRDWVIDAYRNNIPFDQFVTDQLAGDLIPNATVEQKIASGFNRNHTTTDEGGAIAEEYLVEYAVDRASTTGSVFLGLTMGCARCHDHKFDPISAEDFYRFYSFFNSVEEPGLYSQTPDPQRAHEPFLEVPTDAQRTRLGAIAAEQGDLKRRQSEATPEEEVQRKAFVESVPGLTGAKWAQPKVIQATSAKGATMSIEADGSVFTSGANPDTDVHEFTLRCDDAKGQIDADSRLLLFEAVPDKRLADGRFGRSPNGNVVVTGLEIERVPRNVEGGGAGDAVNTAAAVPLHAVWGWADFSQDNGDFHFTNLLGAPAPAGTGRGWALDAHRVPGARRLIVLCNDSLIPTGAPEKWDVRVRIHYESLYAKHVMGRTRISLGSLRDSSMLPAAVGNWRLVGPFMGERDKLYDQAFGPETVAEIDFAQNFGSGNQAWRFTENLRDGVVVPLAGGTNVSYVARMIYTPPAPPGTKRHVDVSLGSDDGWRLFVNGKEAAGKNIERAVAADQDKAGFDLGPGASLLVLKIVNTGGDAAYYYKPKWETSVWLDELVAFILPSWAIDEKLAQSAGQAWKMNFFPRYREAQARIDELKMEEDQVKAKTPRTMVMKETDTPRQTFVLSRGQYDAADKSRPVSRGVPAALNVGNVGNVGSGESGGSGAGLPNEAPTNRLGLAKWLMSSDNPLVARVAVNRIWEMLFGNGLVRTSEDFGFQGEWPSHPELLDHLAVEFQSKGWDVRWMLRLMVTSATYRQSSLVKAEVRVIDPENRLLSSYPRRRLTAEQVRDSALYVSGLLVERAGGPSVKPYQPEGLWTEVAMPSSNTRVFERGKGDEMWRRSMYTYWKRAAPPPSLLTFDAPTREFCVIRRASTSTPLQALVLWNDPQFVEASRVLAERTMAIEVGEAGDSADRARLTNLFRRCTAHDPDAAEMQLLLSGLADMRKRFAQAPEDAKKLTMIGDAPVPENLDRAELAAWTMIANSVLNLYRTMTQE